jgi:hypothetical protein
MVGNVSVVEPDTGKVVAKVSIDLDVPATTTTYVSWRVTGGTATPGTDYLSPLSGVRSGTSKIAIGRTEAFVSVAVKGDTNAEPDDTVNLDVTGATGADVVRGHGTLTIQNNDVGSTLAGAEVITPATIVPTLSIGTPVVWEGNRGVRHAAVPLTLSDPAPAPIKVQFTSPGSDTSSVNPDGCHDSAAATVASRTTTVQFLLNQQSKVLNLTVRGNAGINQLFTVVGDRAVVVSGAASITGSSTAVVVDDDGTPTAADPPPVGTYRVSETGDASNPTFPKSIADTSKGCGYPSSTWATISADGRYVAFSSNADNLVGNDTNGDSDVFLKDTWTGDIELISANGNGGSGNNVSEPTAVSADGRFVMFDSMASDLVPGDDNRSWDAFLYDRTTGDLERLGDVHQTNLGTRGATMSADDRYVAFASGAPLTGGCSACTGVFVLDRTTGVTSLVSTGPTGQFPSATAPTISGDGLHVAFLAQDSLGRSAVYEKDLATGHLETVSVNNAGQLGTGAYGPSPVRPALSNDGQVISFSGQFCNMGLPPNWICQTGTAVYLREMWVRDRTTNTTSVASVSSDGTPISDDTDGPSVSGDGRYVIFETDDAAFSPECVANGGRHVYERDRLLGTTQRVDVISAAVPCAADSWTLGSPAVSADGNFVTFTSMVANSDVSVSNPEAVYVNRLR